MIEIKNYSKKYNNNSTKAVDNVSLTINDGEIFAFIGHNGAGKTTTIKSIVGILDFEEGDILINSKSIKKDPIACKKQLAYIPDNPDMYENLKAIDFINFICNVYEVDNKSRQDSISKYAKLFELENNLNDQISSFSHGMKQKLAIISALCHNPKVLILDEPFVGLDPTSVYNLKELMKNMCKNEKTTIFFSTHILEVAEKLCDRVAIIKNGKIIKVGTMNEVKGDSSLESVFLDLEK
ncbi:MAG: ABC transporter ATP-binding protein [Clostridia bacterium]|nr:ABC transporter ATP-binding protein [Clostridia bacterium]